MSYDPYIAETTHTIRFLTLKKRLRAACQYPRPTLGATRAIHTMRYSNPLCVSFFECQPYDQQFTTDEALQSHLQHLSHHFWCNPCHQAKSYHHEHDTSAEALNATVCPFEGQPCNRQFPDDEALRSHLQYSSSQPCNRQFSSDEALQSHLQFSSRQPCNRHFSDDEALRSHLQHSNRHFWCNPCKEVFNSEDALESHLLTSKAHK